MRAWIATLLGVFAFSSVPASAAVDDAGANGFTVTETADIAASPQSVDRKSVV